MSVEYWITRWQQQNIGFHLHEINPALLKTLPRLAVKKQQRCLLPLCGKSLDLIYLEKVFEHVIGIELSPLAVETFFSEQQRPAAIESQADFRVYKNAGLSLYCGDFFNFRKAFCPSIDLIYDRAALVALPVADRKRYIEHIKLFFSEHTVMFLITLQYAQTEMDGPPFSVESVEIEAGFGEQFRIELLETTDLVSNNSNLKNRNLSRLHECCYKIQKKLS